MKFGSSIEIKSSQSGPSEWKQILSYDEVAIPLLELEIDVFLNNGSGKRYVYLCYEPAHEESALIAAKEMALYGFIVEAMNSKNKTINEFRLADGKIKEEKHANI